MNPKISIIMSVYNNEKYLRTAIDSILKQTYKNFEFIITNDASIDNSLEIIKEYAKQDKRIVIIDNKKNIGLTKSLNNMIDICKGEFIARMDGDDISILNRLEEQINVLGKDSSIDVLFTDTILINEDSEKICESWRPRSINNILKYLPFNNFIPHPTVIIKSNILQKYKYNEKYLTSQDKELWVRLNNDMKNFYYLKKSLLLYRINPNSVRNKTANQSYNLARKCINNNCKMCALKYIKYLSLKEKLVIISKIFIPFSLMFYRGLLIRKRCENE